ncbi:MAG: hypothetical protein QOH61_2254 [Chloroflexota bacterium]|jgi:hypothetical protein|nr:hypothetical protein [Chloroflexota bacterium]
MSNPNDPMGGQAAPPPPPPPPPQARAGVSSDQMSAAISGITSRLSMGETFAAAGALLVLVISWLLVAFLLDGPAVMSDLAIVASAGILLLIWLRLGGSSLVGANYRLILVALAGILAITASVSLLYFIRAVVTPGVDYSALGMLGRIAYWVGGGLAAFGAYQEWRSAPRA